MRKSILLFLGTAILFAACAQNEEGGLVTPKGYSITFHSGPSEPTVQPGEYALLSFFATSGDTSLMAAPMDQEAKIPKEYNKRVDLIGGIMMMGLGDSATIHIPMDSLSPQSKANPLITDGINYHLKIKEILDSASYAARKEAEMAKLMGKSNEVDSILQHYLSLYQEGQLANELQTSSSGLEILMLETGSGDRIQSGDAATVNYTGVFKKDGKTFDSSFGRGRGFDLTVGVGSVIKGWDEGLQQFNRGGSGILFIPYDLAYGEAGRGSIGPKEDLVFYIEIVKE